ncbi:flagellar filament capping protein FliD [Candidatus Magnetominusculus dajiuhuensis]|uniref:flagellar filament capping protein FliD n=1 Tax=Candidatus Magnetominusculus dajiuhuensis TaxID=3137712 RepID=UPI003B431223
MADVTSATGSMGSTGTTAATGVTAPWTPTAPPVALSTGVSTGLNTTAIINASMQVDVQPYNNLATKAASYQSEISAYGQISSSLSTLQKAVAGLTSANISAFNVTSSNQTILTATASAKASPGSYSIKVSQLAQNEEVISQAYASDATVAFATGTLNVGNDGHTTTINIDRSNNTLSGIRDAINRSATDVSASVINDGTGYRLIVSTKNGGAINGLQITGTSTGPTGLNLSDLSYDSYNPAAGPTTLLQTGSDASFTVNGLAITSHTNTLTNVLKGVTINLQSATSPSAVTLNIGQNSASSSTGLKTFVTAYNDVLTQLSQVSSQGQPLYSDMTVKTIQSAIRTMTTTYFNGATSILAQFGINHLKDGTLQIDTAAMDKAVSYNQLGFNKLLDALSYKYSSYASKTPSAYGMLNNLISSTIANVTTNMQTNISTIQTQQSSMSEQLNNEYKMYQQKYANLEATISQLKSQSGSLSSTSSSSSSTTSGTSGIPTLNTTA